MKALATFFFLMIMALTSQAQTDARLHQVVHSISDKINVIIDNNNQVNIKETYSSVVIVEVIVSIDNASKSQIEEWIRTGRYHLQQEEKDGVVYLRSQKEQMPIIINGKEAEEYVIYNISVPEYMDWELQASSLPKKEKAAKQDD